MAAEAATQKRSIAFARSLGVEVIRMSFRPGVASGWPDVLFLIPGGRPLMVEFKAPRGSTTPMQRHRLATLARLGYDVAVAYDFDTAREAIARAVERARLPA